MADVTADKRLKLANTKKRFKELQELKKKRNEGNTPKALLNQCNSNESSTRTTPIEAIAVDFLSPLEPPADSFGSEIKESILTEEPATLPNYFSDVTTPAAFFDNIPSNNNVAETKPYNEESSHLLTYFNTSQEEENNEAIGMPRYFDNTTYNAEFMGQPYSGNEDYKLFPKAKEVDTIRAVPQVVEDKDVVCQNYPEIEANEANLKEFAKTAANNKCYPSMQYNEDLLVSPTDNEKLFDYLGASGTSQAVKEDICTTNDQIDTSTIEAKWEVQHSNVESLKQLSDQLAQMIEPSYEYSANGITDLEKRNIELAANLETEKLQSEQLRTINNQLQSRILQLEAEPLIKTDLHSSQEIAQLKGDLQNHLQTIGLLVAEKTELSSNLSQYEMTCKQKTTDCEELQARLKASRSRVADMERELNSLKSEKLRSESLGEQYSSALDNLRQEYIVLKEQKDELAQDLLEVREKLKNTEEENVKWLEENKGIKNKLALAEVKIQQLASGGALGVDPQIEQLTQEKFSLESKIMNLNQMLQSTIKERDESTFKYQQYAQQLNEQLQQDKEKLLQQEQDRIKHIGALEKQLQGLQNEQVAFATRSSSSIELKNDLEKSRELCVQMQIEKTAVEENYTKVCNEKDLLLKELDAKTDSIAHLESLVEQLEGNQPDSVKLLATMESDKVAASMAIQQNKELKLQLEGMQEVVMKMDNDKVELTENLKAQQQTNKELLEKLQKTETTLHSMADAIEIKDHELLKLRESSENMTRQALQHEQLEDRLRHYEAHDNSAHILQQELLEARQTIAKLREESKQTEEGVDLQEAREKITQLSNEVNRLRIGSDEVVEEIDTNENVLDKENVMKYLEEKVKRTMQEIADLSDEKQRLEHIVLQLQGETETIGEYVALYQHQRMVLKQRALEKDHQLKQLANDREQVKVKLNKLNELIKKLVPVEVVEEHSKMEEEEGVGAIVTSKIGDDKETADEIITLLTEIKSSNLVEPDESFHHCPWCSGQLITV
ncbi:golgin subfamily A member 2-like isoform X2 [Euwallacea fornicatus]|uniref:golgin subfamily A member 2-like isoform X2 n=1 Tax=Euwallacea fornicatus TaxID=995702 RepID=UPI00338F7A88